MHTYTFILTFSYSHSNAHKHSDMLTCTPPHAYFLKYTYSYTKSTCTLIHVQCHTTTNSYMCILYTHIYTLTPIHAATYIQPVTATQIISQSYTSTAIHNHSHTCMLTCVQWHTHTNTNTCTFTHTNTYIAPEDNGNLECSVCLLGSRCCLNLSARRQSL